MNPFAVGVAVDALSGVRHCCRTRPSSSRWAPFCGSSRIIISIIFVMRYAKKVKADKGSTILSLQEQQDHEGRVRHEGVRRSRPVDGRGRPAPAKLMTGRQKWALIVFAPHVRRHDRRASSPGATLGVEIFEAGQLQPRRSRPQVSGDDISCDVGRCRRLAGATEGELARSTGDVTGTVTAEEQVVRARLVRVPHGPAAGAAGTSTRLPPGSCIMALDHRRGGRRVRELAS